MLFKFLQDRYVGSSESLKTKSFGNRTLTLILYSMLAAQDRWFASAAGC
jgi:hypothetical protein